MTKNFKGGYKIVSLQENDLASLTQLDGLNEAIAESYEKPLLVTGIVISGEKKNDVYTTAVKNGTSYTFVVYGKLITVASDDSITIASDGAYCELDLSDFTFDTTKTNYSDYSTKVYSQIVAGLPILISKPFKIKVSGTAYTFNLIPQFIDAKYIKSNGCDIVVKGYYTVGGSDTTMEIEIKFDSSMPAGHLYSVVPEYSNTLTVVSIYSGTSGTFASADLDKLKSSERNVINYNAYGFFYLQNRISANETLVYANIKSASGTVTVNTIEVNKGTGAWSLHTKTLS